MSTETIRQLTKNDRCDRCGAAAKIALQMKSGLELAFCSHHYQDHGTKLTEENAVIVGLNQE
jgi:hypothetical protein